MKKFGYGKGSLSKAAAEAILNWVSSEGEKPVFEGKDVDVDSVKL